MSHVVTLRLSDEEYDNLKKAVQRTRLPQSEFIRNALANRVHAVMQVKSIKQESEVGKEMVSKNNVQVKDRYATKQVPHYGIRKLSVGVASVLLGTTFYMGMNGNVVHADTVNGQDSETPGSQVANSDSNSDSTANSDANVDKTAFGDKQAVGPSAEPAVINEVNTKPQVTEITNDSHGQSATNAAKSDVDANAQGDAVNAKSDTKTPSNEMFSSVATETSPVPMSPSSSSSSQGAVTAPVESEASNETNGQTQPSSTTNTTQTKLSHRPVMRLAAATTTNSNELIVSKDVTISDFSVTVAEGKNEFENAHANIKFTMHADDPSALAGKRLTIRVDTKVWGGFYLSEQQGSNPMTISYQGHVIGTFNYGYPFNFVYITFNDDVKNYAKIDVQVDLVIAGSFQRDIPYKTSLYTSTQAKDGQTYYLTNDVTIGQQKYSSNLPSVIHYSALDSSFVDSVTDVTTTSYAQKDSELYAGTFYKTPNGIYYSQSLLYGGNNLYSEQSGRSGYLEGSSINVGTDIVTDRTQSYTATSDIDPTKLSPAPGSKLVPTKSYTLSKGYWDDKDLLSNTRDVYVDDSQTYSSTATADATVTKDGVIFNKLNGKSLATQIVNIEYMNNHAIFSRRTNYVTQTGKLYLTPALFKQLQAVAESDQNLAKAVNTVKTTGMDAEIKLVNPIDTGLKATIKTSDGKTKEVSLLIDTIDYSITTASTAPKGSILVAAQGKTAKVYHPGDQNIPAVVDQSQLTKTITRTINVHEPGKSVTTTKQTVTLTQSVSVVDGKDVTYNGDWKAQGDSQWASYDVPSVPGYTVSQSYFAQHAVTDTTQDQTVDVTYTANDHQISIEYVDNATGQVVKTDHMSGKTGQIVSITPHVPDGWELVSGQSVPSEVTVGADGAPTTVIKVQPQERSVAIKFVDDEDFNQQVGQAITLTGRDGDTVKVNVTVPEPDKYRLADGQQLPTTYTFTNGSGDVTIHLVHQVVQREVMVDVKLAMMTGVDIEGVDEMRGTITQERWGQLGDKFNDVGPGAFFTILPSVEVGTLTGHVNYDVVDSKVVSLGDDWTTLNLGGHTYQLPNGVDVVNGVLVDSDDGSFGKSLREYYLTHYAIINPGHSVDPDYATRPWYGYLSVNETNDPNNSLAQEYSIGLQGSLAGNEPNALAKANGDRAATSVEMTNKTIDSNLLRDYDFDFSKQDGQLRADVVLPVFGVYVPYVEKTATRTINVITPDGKTTTVKQTATLAKQVDFGKDAHPNWTTSEWTSYDVPTISGYTASQSNVAKETVTDTTEDQTVNVTYTPDAQKLNVKFIDDTTGQVLKTVAKTGVTNANAGYNTQSDIQSYEGQHYVLVSDSSNGANLVFDNDDNIDQAYEVHLRHGAHQIDEHHTITQTVHYIATDHAGVPDDHTVSVQFDRDGYHDEVTGDDHWNAWKQGSTQTFAEVPTPKKAGYTPDKASVPAIVVNPLDHNQTIDVTYTPDTQKVIITFIDDTDNGKTLKTVTKTGPTNSSAGYTTGNDINTYKDQHYVLVSDQTRGQSITFDTDTNTDQRYEVHLKHGTHQINDHRTITETVHYKMTDGTTAPTDYTAKAEFSRDGFNDEVTGTDHWNAWTPSATHQFDAVQSPVVKGYTPDTDQIPAVTVNPDSQSIERTVTYSPDAQKLDVTFIDDTAGTTLKTVVKNGVTRADAKYNTKSDIQNFERQHYVLVSDSSKGDELSFDNDDAADQHYEVHLKHATHVINEHHTVNETVHYKMSDGTKAPADYQAKALSFSRDGFNDEVTGLDHWNAWTPKAEQTFDKVVSPLVAGYTPDIAQIDAQTVKPADHDLAFTVTYTPNVQIAHVKYIDDTDHKVLTQDDLNGRTGETSGYHTTDRITEFKGQHYDLVSDNYPAEGMTFDNHDRIDQTYEVHFKHATRTDEQDVQVPRTIKYVYQDGRPAQPDHSDALKFHETKVVDLVDGHTVSDDWTPAQDFKTIETPAIQGYTPDHSSVSNTGIAHDHSAIVETVTYNPDAQKAVVKYIDDTTGEQLEAKDLTGVSDQSTGYSTKKTIDGYVNQHYVLVSDGTHGETVVFDHDDGADQAYEVHFKHGTEPANESRIKKITVHYQYADGLVRSGKAADDKAATNLTFKRTGTHDLVTDKIAWNAWDHADQIFSAINSPAIQGYTPDRTVVDNVKVSPDSHDLTEVTVTYNADSQKLSVDFIDDTTGKTLKTINKIGYSDESADYNTKSDIQDLISKHYDLTSDQTNGENLVFDHDDNTNQHYEVHLSHHTHQINEQHTITETVHYQYADGLARSGKAANDFNAVPLSFSRDGFNDEVTGVDHWNAWTPADQQSFAAVQSPVIEGYTPDQSEISAINVVPTSQSIEKTVTYTADAQKLTVNFIDYVTGQILKTVTKTGYSDESAGYNTKSDLQGYLAKHYDLVSDATNGAELVFDHNDAVDQAYDVHLTHHLTPISDHQVVNETIHYVYADSLARTGKAADDYVAAPLEFNRTGKHDDVTGTDAWDAWVPGSSSFAAVQSPAIQGYTPDQAQIDAASVNANSQDIVKTVTYSADPQTVTIDFIDDTNHGKVLKTVTKTGGSDEAVGYNTKADIQTFVDGHYKLDHDTSNGANLVFDHDDAVDQHYEVHLTHETAPISEATSTNQVIHYQLADGTPVAKDYTAKVDFSRDGFKDLVTNADHWNAWTPNATQTFDAVVSPAKAGYTPDHAQVDAVTVEPHHADLETTVTYSPDAQKAAVKYIDDTTGKTLQTKELTGVSDEMSTYTTESTIKQYVGQHYKLVSDQTNGKSVVFDHDDASDQTFEIHLTHTYQSVSQEHQVHQTIHYQYADGKQARPDYTAKALAFSRTGTQDLVTEKIQWNAWTPDQVFAAVNTPAVNGYTPDIQTVAATKVSHDSKNIEQTVIYHADDQTILVNYIDDETHSTLKTDSIIGKTSQTSDYTTKKSLDQYKGQHYDVVSDDTHGDTLTFDSDSTKVQIYNVHLKHQHQAASDKATVHQTVHYVYQDGKQAAKDHTATPIEFTRTGDTDLVTGKTTWNAWTPATGTFVAVLSPVITGYTPSRAMIDHVDVHPGDKDLDTTVTYVPDRQVIVVNYIDQTTGKTLKTDTLTGHSDQNSGYTTKTQIDSYIGQHYQFISDATNGQTLTFDHDDQATQTYDVVLGHQTEAAHRSHEVHETVDYFYADGSQAAKSFAAQPLVFSQTGVHDLVTNTTDWNGDWTQPQVFAAVESPKITGFTASKPEVKAVKVNHESSDVHELVIYAANAQTAQIKYVDDVTGNVLETDGANGHFNESIVFSHNVNDQISKFKQAHYKLVSNNFAGQKYQADDTKNVYEVHLTHERQNVHVTDTVTETVKFQYADGSQAQPTKIQAVNFGRDGIKDLVTGTTAWMPVDSQMITGVEVPKIDGYTADIDQVPAFKVNFGDDDITKIVTYTANDQTAGIKIIDDTTGKVLNTQSTTGKFGTEIQFKQNPDQQVIDLQAQHYELVSDNFKHQKYQANNAKNQFEIHVKHQMMDVQRTDKVTETVRYQDNHGNMLYPVTTQTKMFTEHGITDQVTGKTVWTPAQSQTMDVVSAPEVTGYTPNKQSVPATTVNFGDKDINEVIVYTPVSETANIKYIDDTTGDTTGETLLSDQVTGDFGTQIKFDHDPLTQINQYEGQGYELVSNSYGKTEHQFSATSGENNFEVHFKHGTTPVVDTDMVTETIHYLGPDGNKLAPDKTQTITFTRHGVKDQVTGQIDWNSVEPQEFNAVKSPVINGYQVDIAVVEGRQVLFGDQDVVVNVHYTKLPEQQPGSNMVNTGKVTPEKVVTVSNGTVQETNQDAINNPAQSTMQDTKQLPQTGNDNRAGLLSLIGSSLMASLAVFGLGKKKKHEN